MTRLFGQRRRRGRLAWTVAVVLGSAALVGCGRGPDPAVQATASDGTSATTAAAPDSSTTTTAVPDSTTLGSSTTTTPVAKAPTTTTRPPVTTTTTAPGAPTITTAPEPEGPDMMTLPAGGAVFPYQAGRADWVATSNGYTISVHADPAAPRRGQVMHFSITVAGPGATCCEGLIGYDGHFVDQVGRAGTTCPSVATNTFDQPFVYNTTGLVRFKVAGGDCSWAKIGWLSGWLQIGEGQSTIQGPARPSVTAGGYRSVDHADDHHYFPLFLSAQDPDGWIHHFTVDWGDGTALATYAYDPFPCKAVAPDGWPQSNYVSLPSDTLHPLVGLDGQPVPSTEHHYAIAGTYTVTVTATSTACDGSQPQDGQATTSWTVNP